jgi:hypothetical protein
VVTERKSTCSRNLATLSTESPNWSIILLLPWSCQKDSTLSYASSTILRLVRGYRFCWLHTRGGWWITCGVGRTALGVTVAWWFVYRNPERVTSQTIQNTINVTNTLPISTLSILSHRYVAGCVDVKLKRNYIVSSLGIIL